jgi:hypothetical protein
MMKVLKAGTIIKIKPSPNSYRLINNLMLFLTKDVKWDGCSAYINERCCLNYSQSVKELYPCMYIYDHDIFVLA